MKNILSERQPLTDAKPPESKPSMLKQWWLPALALLLSLGVMVFVFFTFGRHPERLAEFKNFVYVGAFFISLIGNATLFLPGAVLVLLSGIGGAQYQVAGISGPILVGLAGGLGAALGESTGYFAGYSGKLITERWKNYQRVVKWMRKWGGATVLILSVVPFFFDLVGLAAGNLRYPYWKFLVFSLVGRALMYSIVITLAALGWANLAPYFG